MQINTGRAQVPQNLCIFTQVPRRSRRIYADLRRSRAGPAESMHIYTGPEQVWLLLAASGCSCLLPGTTGNRFPFYLVPRYHRQPVPFLPVLTLRSIHMLLATMLYIIPGTTGNRFPFYPVPQATGSLSTGIDLTFNSYAFRLDI